MVVLSVDNMLKTDFKQNNIAENGVEKLEHTLNSLSSRKNARAVVNGHVRMDHLFLPTERVGHSVLRRVGYGHFA